jgi:acetate---CoA ligase (ADP-forming)
MKLKTTLDRLFYPQSVAIVGASEDMEKLSGQPLRNLLKVGFKGKVYAVNPRLKEISGVSSYGCLSDIGQPVDVAIICLPAKLAVEAAEECAQLSIPVAIIAVSGFAETGTAEGIQLQKRLAAVATKGTRIVGPNCNGIYNALRHISIGYNVTHSIRLKRGNIAILSHSGALFSSIVSLGSRMGNGIGYSYFVSSGNEADLHLLDYLEYMANDPETTVIALILDGIEDVARFKDLCKKAGQQNKKIVALKIGDSKTGQIATVAHSSRMAESSRVFSALLEACGVIQVPTLETLVGTCAILTKYKTPSTHSAIGISTSGAGCALLADQAERYGIEFPPLSTATIERMNEQKGFATLMNPFDFGASGPRSIGFMTRAMAQDPNAGYTLFYATILQTKQVREFISEQFANVCEELERPPFIVIAPGPLTSEEVENYQKHDIIVFSSTDTAFQCLQAMKNALESITYGPKTHTMDLKEEIKPYSIGMDEQVASGIMRIAAIPIVEERIVNSVSELVSVCRCLGYPVVIKGLRRGITHKSEDGMVWVHVQTDDEVSRIVEHIRKLEQEGMVIEKFLVQEYVRGEAEVLIGITKEPEMGYTLVVGSGGKYAEILDDSAICMIPATRETILKTLASTKIGQILSGHRNNGLTPDGVVKIADQLQYLISHHESEAARAYNILAIELNPVIVSRERTVAVDYRIMVQDPTP